MYQSLRISASVGTGNPPGHMGGSMGGPGGGGPRPGGQADSLLAASGAGPLGGPGGGVGGPGGVSAMVGAPKPPCHDDKEEGGPLGGEPQGPKDSAELSGEDPCSELAQLAGKIAGSAIKGLLSAFGMGDGHGGGGQGGGPQGGPQAGPQGIQPR